MLNSAELNQGTTEVPSELSNDAPLAFKSGTDGQSLHTYVEREFDLTQIMRRSYRKDPLFAKIMTHPKLICALGYETSSSGQRARWAEMSSAYHRGHF